MNADLSAEPSANRLERGGWVEELPVLSCKVGYGSLGLGGQLGYENQVVRVQGCRFSHAVSAHGPSEVRFALPPGEHGFHCRVALNDDVRGRSVRATFVVMAGEQVVGVATDVRPGESRPLCGRLGSTAALTLSVEASPSDYCHTVWLDPQLESPADQNVPWRDALDRVELAETPKIWKAESAIVTLATSGYEPLLDQLLGSLNSWGQCADARRFVLLVDSNPMSESVVARRNAVPLRCRRRAVQNQGLKAALYSIATLIDARYYLCLDADTLVLGDLRPIFDALQALPANRILVAGDAFLRPGPLGAQFSRHYKGQPEDWKRLLTPVEKEASYPFVVNDGVFAGSRRALLGIDGLLRALPDAISWVDELPDHGWRNQFIFNLMLARLNCAVELDPIFNLQMHMNDVQWSDNCRTAPVAIWRGRPAKVLHYCGWGRSKDESMRRAAAQDLGEISDL